MGLEKVSRTILLVFKRKSEAKKLQILAVVWRQATPLGGKMKGRKTSHL